MGTVKEGIRLYRLKKYDLALKEFQETGEDPSENVMLGYYLGLCYTHMKEYEKALIYLEQVVTASGDFLHIYQCRMVLGFVYAVTARYKLAEFEMLRIMDEGYESSQVHAALGWILYKAGNTEKAILQLRRALEMDPKNLNAINSLGFVLADATDKYTEALNLLRQATAAKPEYPAYLDSYGWACFKAGRYEDARKYLRKALDLAPDEEEIRLHFKECMKVNV
jgi:tetratricopeptide (TPR) repeat protein